VESRNSACLWLEHWIEKHGISMQSLQLIERKVISILSGSPFMKMLGITVERVVHGQVILGLRNAEDHAQQHGFMHAGVQTTAMDAACGFAAYSTFGPGEEVLSTEFSTHLLRPATGKYALAIGTVIKPGKTLTYTEGELHMFGDE